MVYLVNPVLQLVVLAGAFAAVHLAATSRSFIFFAHTVLFALLTGVLVFQGIEPYSTTQHPDGTWTVVLYGAAKAIWWIGGALMLISFVRLVLIFEERPREGRLVQDLIAGIIYIGAGLSIVAYVFNIPVGTLIATSGVIAVILGLALQSTLSDVFSGVALNLGRPYSIGDWIILDTGVQGRVVETNWRATHLLNATNDLVVIPNSNLAKSQLVNQSSPDEAHGISIGVRVITSRTPLQIQHVFETIVIGSKHTLRDPPALITLGDIDGQSIAVDLSFRVADAGQIIAAKNEMLDLIFRHLKAEGLQLVTTTALPAYMPTTPVNPIDLPADSPAKIVHALPLFSSLTADELKTLSTDLSRHPYPRGTEIIQQGERSPTLMIVAQGVVAVERDDGGRKIELNRLSPGDFLGERGLLMGAAEPGTIRTLTTAVVYELSAESIAKVLRDRPDLADEIGSTLSARLDAEAASAGGSSSVQHRPLTISNRIRQLFQL
ncbi:mechanosensitive ion channel family protein [Oryzifoliimicrobium ureilyticus]|uniref:mechanosensitive ion channel family protein n=1 Tax=Oryzifoliimicrobium ureilyticus TaxID=3113724 RepID=UPI0030760163